MTRTAARNAELTQHIGLGQGIALYVSAILGAGVLVLPGQVASMAGPASLVSWAVACAMGVPLAWMFAALARRFPHAGGVSTYVSRAYGPTAGGLAGWLYFVAGSVGQTIVPLTGGYYVAEAFGLGGAGAFVVAGAILALAVLANLAGLTIGARTQLALAAAVALALVLTVVVTLPRMDVDHLTPFAPHGLAPVGAGVVVLFFAFAGWEAVAHLAGEFTDPARDLPRAAGATIVIITVLYLGIAAAVVLTGTYGTPEVDHIAIGLLLQDGLGGGAALGAAVIAVVVSLGTTRAFVAGVSRLGFALAQEGWLPRSVGRVRHSVPVGGVLTVGLVALGGLVLAAMSGWGTETLVLVPSTLVVAVYLLAAAAGLRLLAGAARVCAAVTIALTLAVVPSAVEHVVVVLATIALALLARTWFSRTGAKQPGEAAVTSGNRMSTRVVRQQGGK